MKSKKRNKKIKRNKKSKFNKKYNKKTIKYKRFKGGTGDSLNRGTNDETMLRTQAAEEGAIVLFQAVDAMRTASDLLYRITFQIKVDIVNRAPGLISPLTVWSREAGNKAKQAVARQMAFSIIPGTGVLSAAKKAAAIEELSLIHI